MKKYILLLLLNAGLPALAQTGGLNNALRLLLEESGPAGIVRDILVEGDIEKLRQNQQRFNYRFNYSAGNIASITTDIRLVQLLIRNEIIRYAEYIPANKRPLNDSMLNRNRVKAAKLWTAPLPQAYNGEGVIMGIIDTGVDFTHPDLQDSLGKTRVLAIWDQKLSSGSTVPQPFNYGIEWSKTQIDNGQCTHNDLAYYGHGTGVCGISAGNARATGKFEGVASKSDLIVVAFDFGRSGPTTADALNFILSKAAALGRPCAVNVSIGNYYGSHDGTDLEAKMIDNMLKNIPGRALVAAAGNAGSVKFHVKTQPVGNDTLFSWLSGTGSIAYWCYGDTLQVKSLQLNVGANRNSFSDIGNIGFKNYNYALNTVKYDTLKNNSNQRIAVVTSVASINASGVYELYFGIAPDSTGLLWRIETKGNGLHHAWNFAFVSGGLPSASQYPKITKYVTADSTYGIVSSFQCSEEVTTVGNYNNVYSFYDVTQTLRSTSVTAGQLSIGSSRGPTRDGRIKPDVAATGEAVFKPLVLSLKNSYISNSPASVAEDSMHVYGGGTSDASPIAAGVAALYLQRFPNATSREVKEAIRYCAYTDNYTGQNLPDYKWGFGKVDGKATLYCREGIYDALNKRLQKKGSVFPNPFRDKLTLDLGTMQNTQIEIYTSNGALLFRDVFFDNRYEVNSTLLPPGYSGLLLLKISNNESCYTFKVVKEN